MEIQVTEQVYELAKKGLLMVITCQLDPGADKAIQEGARPEQITLRARGTRRKGLKFQVKSSGRVHKGYAHEDTRGQLITRMIRTTARVFLGGLVPPPDHSKLPTDHEIPPG